VFLRPEFWPVAEGMGMVIVISKEFDVRVVWGEDVGDIVGVGKVVCGRKGAGWLFSVSISVEVFSDEGVGIAADGTGSWVVGAGILPQKSEIPVSCGSEK